MPDSPNQQDNSGSNYPINDIKANPYQSSPNDAMQSASSSSISSSSGKSFGSDAPDASVSDDSTFS